MLEALINYTCALLLAFLGYYVIKKIINSDIKINKKNILILVLNALVVTLTHIINYQSSYILSCITNIVTYKLVFKLDVEESLLVTGILMLVIAISDIAFLPVLMNFTSITSLESNIYVSVISNVCVMTIVMIIINIRFIQTFLSKIYIVLKSKEINLNIIFIIFILMGISSSSYNILISSGLNTKIIANILIIIVLVAVAALFAQKQNNYNKLSSQYDTLFSYVKNFENWIEKEQFVRHEYKNQLAVIYALTEEKNVKDKINEILNNVINIENKQINLLKVLPKGGLKGLMYYKTSVAQSYKINVTIDISINEKGTLSKLNNKKINELTKIIGIYYDNAIEAAKESKKKNILIEIYELKDSVKIVISNTFNKNSIVTGPPKKGISSKGKGRGNGRYFASNIINKNKWIEEKQEIIDKYYIETITIIKNASNK